jgi:hypothetical protein
MATGCIMATACSLIRASGGQLLAAFASAGFDSLAAAPADNNVDAPNPPQSHRSSAETPSSRQRLAHSGSCAAARSQRQTL